MKFINWEQKGNFKLEGFSSDVLLVQVQETLFKTVFIMLPRSTGNFSNT